MLNTERKCRRIKLGRIPFSPELALWICHAQVYKSILQYHDGHIKNRGNLKQMAQRCRIERCFLMSVEEILVWLRVCTEKCDYFRKHSQKHCKKHLNDCLSRAREMDDPKKEHKILAIIQRGKNCSFWRRLNYVMGKSCNGSVWHVLVEDKQNGTLTKHITQESVK